MEQFYSIEKYFPFENIFKDKHTSLQIFINYLENIQYKPVNLMNANNANQINAIFDLNIPFILKEYEVLEGLEENVNLFKEINKCQDMSEIQRFKGQIIQNFKESSIFKNSFDLFESNDLIKDKYLKDLIRIKFAQLNLLDDLEKLLVHLVKIYLNELDEAYTLGLVYYSVFKCEKIIEKVVEFIKRNVSHFNFDNYIKFVKEKEDAKVFNQDSKWIENKLLASVIDYYSIDLIANLDLSDLAVTAQALSNCWMEIFSIQVNFRFFVNSYWAILFLNETSKTSSIPSENMKKISKLIYENIENNRFLKDLNIISSINQLIQRPNILNEQIFRLKVYFYGLCIDKRDKHEKKIIEFVFNELNSNPELIKYSVILFQKLFKEFEIDISLEFLTKKSLILDAIEINIEKMGIDSNLSLVLMQVLSNQLQDIEEKDDDDEDEDQNFNILNVFNKPIDDEELKECENSIKELFNLLLNYENDFRNEFTETIKYKQIGYLTAVLYFQKLLKYNYKKVYEYGDQEYENKLNTILNELLDKPSTISNSLKIMGLKVIDKLIGSFLGLKEFVLSSQNIIWKKNLNFGDPEILVDFHLKAENSERTSQISRIILDCVHSKLNDSVIKKNLEAVISNSETLPHESLSLLLAAFNSLYLANSNHILYQNQTFKQVVSFIKNEIDKNLLKINCKSLNLNLLSSIVSNFSDGNLYRLTPQSEVQSLKINSIVIHAAAVLFSNTKNYNCLSSLFFDTNNESNSGKEKLFWPCSTEDEEYRYLYELKDTKFVSYSEEEIRLGKWEGKNGFALYKCSNACKYYYTVGGCTRVVLNTDQKCSKGHLLGGSAYNVMHVRDGHQKIPDATNFIRKRLDELLKLAPKGYLAQDYKDQPENYSLRSMKPITYRLLHLIIHSTLHMINTLGLYPNNELIEFLTDQNAEYQINNIDDYLQSHIKKDYELIGSLLGLEDPCLFIHAVLLKLPTFLAKHKAMPDSFLNRNNFEESFQSELVNPLIASPQATQNQFKGLFSVNNQSNNEIKLLIEEINDANFMASIKGKYPLVKLMRVNASISTEHFMQTYRNRNLTNKYPLIDIYLKEQEKLVKLEALPTLVQITNQLMTKFDHNLMRKEAREKKIKDCLADHEFEILMANWNKHLNVSLNNGCKDHPSIAINNETSLLLMLIDNRSEIGSGIHTRLALKYLADIQNDFINNILELELNLLKNFNRELLPIHMIKPSHIIQIESNEFDFDAYVQRYTLVNPEYGKGMAFDYDFEKFEFILMNFLLMGKRLIQTDEEKIRTIQYSGELLAKNVNLIENLRQQIPQSNIDQDKLEEINFFIEQLKCTNSIDELKKIFTSLDTIIWFMSKNKAGFKSKTIKDFVNSLELKNISDYVRKQEPIASLLLGHIVEVYEIFENEIFFLTKNNFEDKYKYDLNENELKDFDENFWPKCNDIEFPSKMFFYRAFIKFSMRCLHADIDENEALSVYLQYRTDLWPTNNDKLTDLLENLQEKFPAAIKVKHTLGNLFKKMNLELTVKNEKKKEIIIIPNNERIIADRIIGRGDVISSKKKIDKKNSRKNELIDF